MILFKNDSGKMCMVTSGWTIAFNHFLDEYLGLAISISFHLLLLAGLSFLVFYTEKEDLSYSKIGITDLSIPKLDIRLEDRSSPAEIKSKETSVSSGTSSTEETAIASEVELHIENAPSAFFEKQAAISNISFGDGVTSLGNTVLAKGIYHESGFTHRKNPGRRGGGSGGGGNLETIANDMVAKALHFLKNAQNADGSWGDSSDEDLTNAISSLALLAFLAYGEDTGTSQYSSTLRSGLRYLHKQASKNARPKTNGFGDALLTYVLAEGASITQIPELLDATRQRIQQVQRMVSMQADSWNAGTLSPWNYQALKAASFALSQKEFTDFTQQSARNLLQYHRQQSASLGKTSGRADVSEVFNRTYCLQLFGYGNHKMVQDFLKKSILYNQKAMLKSDWQEPQQWPLYHWYYRTNSLYADAYELGSAWEQWNKNLVKMLSSQQNSDGSFMSPEISAPYNQSGENLSTFKSSGNLAIYSTAMCALMLQTKFRYLSSYFSSNQKESLQLPPQSAGEKIGTTAALKKLGISF